jgi:hypothetical protein
VLTLAKLILATVIVAAAGGGLAHIDSSPSLGFLPQAGSPEDGDPEVDKPAQCDNYISTPEAHRCHCLRDRQKCSGLPQGPADVRMDKSCLTYCRAQKCLCAGHGCRS